MISVRSEVQIFPGPPEDRYQSASGFIGFVIGCRRLLSGIGLVDIVKRVLDVRRGARAFRGEGLAVRKLEAGCI